MMDDSLIKWLDGISISKIPSLKKKKKTLMDIAGIDHLETKWSSIYAYFFDSKETHGLGTLFYDSLLAIILKRTGKNIQMDDFYVKTEVPAQEKNGTTKFIDLLIRNRECAIIIENKVNASLYNPLEVYWKSIEIEDDKKCGVVLSLKAINVNNHNFINVTHEDLIKQVENNLFKYYALAEPKSLLFLQDFIQNINNQKNTMDEKALSFYFKGDNHLKINKLAKIQETIIESISRRIEDDSMNQLLEQNGLKLKLQKKKNDQYTYYTFIECNQAMIKLVYNSLWNFEKNGCRIRAILEFQGDIKAWLEGRQSAILQKANLGLTNTEGWLLFPNPAIELGDDFQQKICEKLENSEVYKLGNEIVKQFAAQKK